MTRRRSFARKRREKAMISFKRTERRK